MVGITGASGSPIAQAVVDKLLERSVRVAAIASGPAKMVWREEMGESFGTALERWAESEGFRSYSNGDFLSPIASGTYPTRGMAVVPCSMGTVAAISVGMADNLIRRSADVCLKERRPLVLVPRETPLTAIQLENMAKLARVGAVVLPPEPAFYLHPGSLADVVDFVAERTLMALGVTDSLPDRFRYDGMDGGY